MLGRQRHGGHGHAARQGLPVAAAGASRSGLRGAQLGRWRREHRHHPRATGRRAARDRGGDQVRRRRVGRTGRRRVRQRLPHAVDSRQPRPDWRRGVYALLPRFPLELADEQDRLHTVAEARRIRRRASARDSRRIAREVRVGGRRAGGVLRDLLHGRERRLGQEGREAGRADPGDGRSPRREPSLSRDRAVLERLPAEGQGVLQGGVRPARRRVVADALCYRNRPDVHLNADGYALLAELLHARGAELGYWPREF